MQDALSMEERLLLALTTLLLLFGTLLALLTVGGLSGHSRPFFTLVLRGHSVLFRVQVGAFPRPSLCCSS
jgi:hypothetical protein